MSLTSSSAELAVLDPRTPQAYADGHLAIASNAPYQELEACAPRLVPRRGTPVVLAGDPETDARAADVLARLGYTDVRPLDGGVDGWRRSGGRVYTGTNVRSKALGEWVERRYGTPAVDPETVRSWLDDGVDVLIVDSRTTAEYRHHHIPGGLHTGGGAEVVYRVGPALRGPDTRVVVNCQGRTRGIMGAQSLINAGLPNPVYSLRNGTPAWQWAGLPLAGGDGDRLDAPPEPSAEARRWADRTLAGLATAPAYDLDATTYLLDVRSAEEHAAGHPPGSVSAPGGQLVQAFDTYVAVRGARLVLIDTPDRIRAATTAHWLRYLHDGPIAVITPDAPVPEPPAPPVLPSVGRVSWKGLADGTLLYDLRSSAAYLAGHVPDAVHVRRETLDRLVDEGERGPLALIGDAAFAPEYVAADLAARGVDVAVLGGGAPSTTADPVLAAGVQDRVGAPDFGPERDAWYRAYFAWELSLPELTAGDPLFDFDRVAP